MALPNLKLYRITWLAAVVLALLSFFALQPTRVPALTDQPTSFDGRQALYDLRSLAEGYPKRVAGSDSDSRAALWLSERIQEIGLEPHFDGLVASIEGRATPLQNVWTVSKGQTDAAILLVANRDSPPLDTQGADDNASGVASLLELARVFTLEAHSLTLVFLWSDGDAYGAVGTRDFIQSHPELDIRAAIALSRVGTGQGGRHKAQRVERQGQRRTALAVGSGQFRRKGRGKDDAHPAAQLRHSVRPPGRARGRGQSGAARGRGHPRTHAECPADPRPPRSSTP